MAKVKCPVCSKKFDRETVEYVKHKNRYYHKDCYEKEEREKTQIAEQKKKILDYLSKKSTKTLNYPLIQKQINKQMADGYKLSGILGTLHYLEIIRPDFDFSNIGLVPFYYDKAKEYFSNQMLFKDTFKHYDSSLETVTVSLQERKIKQKWSLE